MLISGTFTWLPLSCAQVQSNTSQSFSESLGELPLRWAQDVFSWRISSQRESPCAHYSLSAFAFCVHGLFTVGDFYVHLSAPHILKHHIHEHPKVIHHSSDPWPKSHPIFVLCLLRSSLKPLILKHHILEHPNIALNIGVRNPTSRNTTFRAT